MDITFLGTGANGGIPQLDCSCRNCQKGQARKRSSILVETRSNKIIIDCGPDFKSQLKSVGMKLQDISAILLTHLHWDHCAGLTELSCGKKNKVPIIVPKTIQEKLKNNPNFSFLFKFGFAKFTDKLQNVKIKFIKIKHDPSFDTFAIKLTSGGKSIIVATDIANIDNKLLNEFEKATLIIFDGTFLAKSAYNHICLKESVPLLATSTKTAIFTHINHSEKITDVKKFLKPFNFRIAFDGMHFRV